MFESYEDAMEKTRDYPLYDPVFHSEYIQHNVYVFPVKYKNGKVCNVLGHLVSGPYYRELRECAVCKRVGTNRLIKVRRIGLEYNWMLSSYRYRRYNSNGSLGVLGHPLMCKKCWGEVKPLVDATNLLDEHENILRSVATEIKIQRRKERESDKCRD